MADLEMDLMINFIQTLKSHDLVSIINEIETNDRFNEIYKVLKEHPTNSQI